MVIVELFRPKNLPIFMIPAPSLVVMSIKLLSKDVMILNDYLTINFKI